MKNKKGFTLIEMIGVIVILALLFLLSYTTILNYLKSGQDKVDEGTFNLLKSATKDYLEDNENEYPELDSKDFCIDINILVDNNYIDEDVLVAKNRKLLSKWMKITHDENGQEKYEVSNSCDEAVILDEVKLMNILFGATQQYVEDNSDEYIVHDDNVYCVEINELISKHYVDQNQLMDYNRNILSKQIKITYSNNQPEYNIADKCQTVIKYRKKAVDYLLTKANDISLTTYKEDTEASHQMYTFSHPATVQTEALTDYRYIGKDPYNYVEFNDELWRIIGIFTVENGNEKKEQRIKLLRNEAVAQKQWNNGENDWTKASLQKYLNEQYYVSDINSDSKKLMDVAKYYIGGREHSYSNKDYGSTEDMYAWERGDDRYSSSRSLYWIGNIGVFYTSDYFYTLSNGISDPCFDDGYYCEHRGGDHKKSWMYLPDRQQWTIGHRARYSAFTFAVGKDGDINFYNSATNNVRPVLYLKNEVQIVEGDGTKDNPYKLKI